MTSSQMLRFMCSLCDILAPSNQHCVSPPFPHRHMVTLSPHGDGQKNGNTLICATYVLMLDWDQRPGPPTTPVPPECRVTGEDGEIKMRRPVRPVNQLSYCKNNEPHRQGREVTAVGVAATVCILSAARRSFGLYGFVVRFVLWV